MNTATVEVAFVNKPAAGKKMGNIKLKDGSYYSVSPAMLSQFSGGGTYEVTYEEHDYNGKIYRTVKTVKQAGQANGATPSGGGKHSESSSEDIFVCGVVNNLARAGELKERLTVDGIAKLTHGLRLGWRKGKFPMPEVHTKEQSQEDMNDEIPY